jgi:transposase
MNCNIIGIDIAKTIFQLCLATAQGKIVGKQRLGRDRLLHYLANQEKSRVVMEACGSSNYWAREIVKLGHEVKLIAPQYVKPFVKGNKNDYRDAEAIVEAACRPQMRFVTPKTEDQQDIQGVLRVRDGLVATKIKTMNQIRGLLGEYGHIVKQGESALKSQLPKLSDLEVNNGLSNLMKNMLKMQYEFLQIIEKQIETYEATLKNFVKSDEYCQRLMEIEGIGMMTAAAMVALVGNGSGFKNGRHFAAFIGLVPKQHSSGNQQKLLGISKRGDEYVRRMFIHGARAVVHRSASKKDQRSRWIQNVAQRAGNNRAVVALANKNARIAMSLLLSGQSYRKAA